MKFSLFATLSAFALLSTTTMVSAEDTQKLRGPAGQRHSRSSSRTADADVKIPKFFPTEMTEEQIAIFEDKDTASQKRQAKRDAARDIDNPDRTQREENQERARKTRQSEDRGNSRVDPYANTDGNADEYGRKREAKRMAKCENGDGGCEYSTPNAMCYNDCLDDDGLPGVCSERCRYIGVRCYEDCRGDGDSVIDCLDDCNNAIDRDTGRAADRADCAGDCSDDFRIGTGKYRKCIDNCVSSTDGDSAKE